MNDNIIYELIDPISKELRYIGQTTRGIKYTEKYNTSSFSKKKRYVSSWIKSLHSKDLKVEVIILEDNILTKELLNEAEIFYITYFKFLGCRLVNLAEGGNSNSGWIPNEETRKKYSINCKNNINLQSARKDYFEKNPHPKWHNNPRSEEYKNHLRKQSKEANKLSVEKSSVKIKDQNGSIYNSITEAAKLLNMSKSCISRNINGKSKTVKGYKFVRV